MGCDNNFCPPVSEVSYGWQGFDYPGIIGYFSALTTVLWKIVISDRRRKEIVNELREFQSQLRESHWARQVIDDCINESHCNENLDN